MKLIGIVADGLKLLGVTTKNDEFVSPNSKKLVGKNLEELEIHFSQPQVANLTLLTSLGNIAIKDEFKKLEGTT